MPRFTLKKLFFIVTLAAIESCFLALVAGPRIREYVHGWSVPITYTWIVYGVYLGYVIFAPIKLETVGMVVVPILHFVIAMAGLFYFAADGY